MCVGSQKARRALLGSGGDHDDFTVTCLGMRKCSNREEGGEGLWMASSRLGAGMSRMTWL